MTPDPLHDLRRELLRLLHVADRLHATDVALWIDRAVVACRAPEDGRSGSNREEPSD